MTLLPCSSAAASGAAPCEAEPDAVWAEVAAGWPELLAGGAHLLAVKDARDGRYLAVGSASQALFGLAAEAWVGRNDAELFGAAVANAWRAADELALARTGPGPMLVRPIRASAMAPPSIRTVAAAPTMAHACAVRLSFS